VLSTIIELYLHIPLFTYLESGRQSANSDVAGPSNGQKATIFILQTWTIGLLYLRLFLRVFLVYVAPESQAAIALRAIVRNGLWRPDARLASRAFVLPATFVCFVLLATPLACAKLAIGVLRVEEETAQTRMYRAAYPTMLGICLVWYATWILQRQVATWRAKIRDEVYLIGERLHNFHEGKPQTNLHKMGKEKYL
jgi:E3 ubiquitin-protein ligase MARCH6